MSDYRLMTEHDLRYHGDVEATAGLLDLAVNVRLPAPPPWLRERLAAALDTLGRYPDQSAARAAVARRHARRDDEVLLTAGAAEAFVLLARTLRPQRAACVHPSFTEPEAALRAAGHRVHRVVLPPPYGLAPALVPDDADLVVLGNPTNPTGVLHDGAAVAALARPGRTVVVDEAFADTVPGERGSLAHRRDLPGLLVVRSLTKTWGLAGLRVGYLLGAPDLLARLAAGQPLWPVSTLALVALQACSTPAARAESEAAARALEARRERLAAALDALPGVRIAAPSAASFLLLEVSAGEHIRRELRAAGVAVRRGDTFPGLTPRHLRVAVRDDADTDRTIAAFAAVLANDREGGRQIVTSTDPRRLIEQTVAAVQPLDRHAMQLAAERQAILTKPRGALGALEDVSIRLAGIAGCSPAPVPSRPVVGVFAADHGVHAQGVTPWPQEVTGQMVANFLADGAAVNCFAAQLRARVVVIDVGVAADLPDVQGLLRRPVARGTADMTAAAAMTREQAEAALAVGIQVASELVARGHDTLVTGDMGIANTTASAALVAAFTGADPAQVTGRGTGIDDAMLARKIEVVRRALALHQPDPGDPIGVLSAVGGLEHAALAGFIIGGAVAAVPVLLDGVIAGSAALAAQALAPAAIDRCIAGHRSPEPGHAVALGRLGLRPLVDLDLRLGEGTGALLALPLVQCAARALADMATFDAAGVTDKEANRAG
jgi:nicotinate-nucleotide--dimethylbenzimidazole phosphoribosyltransferase